MWLDKKQIARLIQVVETHHMVVQAYYMGNDCFKVITDKRRFISKQTPKLTDFVLNGIKLERDPK